MDFRRGWIGHQRPPISKCRAAGHDRLHHHSDAPGPPGPGRGHARSEVDDGSLDTTTPDKDYGLGIFRTPDEQGSSYADKLDGLFKPPVTSDYVFFITADDDADLFISTDANPVNKYMIAQEMDW